MAAWIEIRIRFICASRLTLWRRRVVVSNQRPDFKLKNEKKNGAFERLIFRPFRLSVGQIPAADVRSFQRMTFGQNSWPVYQFVDRLSFVIGLDQCIFLRVSVESKLWVVAGIDRVWCCQTSVVVPFIASQEERTFDWPKPEAEIRVFLCQRVFLLTSPPRARLHQSWKHFHETFLLTI